jgi:RNA polymerase sigma factor (sigma-70 family)
MIDIVNIGNQKTSYSDKDSIQFEPLKFYLNLAKKSISKFANQICQGSAQKMLSSEDAIANVANGIMMADWRWDKDRKGHHGQSKTRYSYRNQCAIWAIQSYVTRQYGSKRKSQRATVSIDQNHQDDIQVKDIISSNNLSIVEEIIQKEETTLLKQDIKTLLNSGMLSDRQVEYINMYFFEDMTLEQIGKRFNITREAVRQGLNKAYSTLREVVTLC